MEVLLQNLLMSASNYKSLLSIKIIQLNVENFCLNRSNEPTYRFHRWDEQSIQLLGRNDLKLALANAKL